MFTQSHRFPGLRSLTSRQKRLSLTLFISLLSFLTAYYKATLHKYLRVWALPRLMRLLGNSALRIDSVLTRLLPSPSPPPTSVFNFRSYIKPAIPSTPTTPSHLQVPDLSNIRSKEICISFAGCSWLLPYHLGVATYFASMFKPEAAFNYRVAASSCGCLIGLALIDNVSMHELKAFVHEMAREVNESPSPLSPLGRMTGIVEGGLRRFVKEDTWRNCNGRLVSYPRKLRQLRRRRKLRRRSKLRRLAANRTKKRQVHKYWRTIASSLSLQ